MGQRNKNSERYTEIGKRAEWEEGKYKQVKEIWEEAERRK